MVFCFYTTWVFDYLANNMTESGEQSQARLKAFQGKHIQDGHVTQQLKDLRVSQTSNSSNTKVSRSMHKSLRSVHAHS
jgi:hypothetical protein